MGLRRSTDLLVEIISPGNVPLRDWVDAFGAGPSIRPIGSEWLKSWGVDLRRLSDDRDARNEASYRPTRLASQTSPDVLASSSFLRSLWTMCEPFGLSRFEVLDRHLLRLSLEQAYKAITGSTIQANPHEFERRVINMLKMTKPDGLIEKEWKDFLMWTSDPKTPMLIEQAKGMNPIDHPHHHLEVMARAALLLRVATGACVHLLQQAGFGRVDLEFWWKSLGEDRGLWEPGDEPDELIDLWADVEIAVKEAQQWEIINSKSQPSFARWHKEQPYAISVLGECERIALWGLGL
jgi:hypothetical protein